MEKNERNGCACMPLLRPIAFVGKAEWALWIREGEVFREQGGHRVVEQLENGVNHGQ